MLHHGLDISVDEIARILRTKPGTIKSRLSRAREAAAQLVKEQQ